MGLETPDTFQQKKIISSREICFWKAKDRDFVRDAKLSMINNGLIELDLSKPIKILSSQQLFNVDSHIGQRLNDSGREIIVEVSGTKR